MLKKKWKKGDGSPVKWKKIKEIIETEKYIY